MRFKTLKTLIFVAVIFVFANVPAIARPGDLDPTFGSGGIENRGTWGGYYGARVLEVEPHPDRSISVLGYFNFEDYCGINGVSGFGNPFADLCDFAVLPNGKIVVPTEMYNQMNQLRFAVIRLNPDWQPDATFGSNGVVIPDLGLNFTLRPWKVEINQNGKMTFSGLDYRSSPPVPALVRLNADGSPDTSFGYNGVKFYPGLRNRRFTRIFLPLRALRHQRETAFFHAKTQSSQREPQRRKLGRDINFLMRNLGL